MRPAAVKLGWMRLRGAVGKPGVWVCPEHAPEEKRQEEAEQRDRDREIRDTYRSLSPMMRMMLFGTFL